MAKQQRTHSGLQAALAALAMSMLLAACREPQPALPTPTLPPTPTPTAAPQTPEETLDAFYQWYLAYPGNPLVRGAYRTNENLRPYLADELVSRVDALLAALDESGGGYDPFLCGQDWPTRLETQLMAQDGHSAQVRVSRYYAGNPEPADMLVELALSGGRWQIRDVVCSVPAGTAAATPTLRLPGVPTIVSPATLPAEEWGVYHNERYGFHISHPPQWYAIESHNPAAFPGDPVAGYVDFIAGGQPVPIALVISTGSFDAFRLVFPVPEGGSREVEIGAYRMLVEDHFDGETYTIIPHPHDEALRVALRVIRREVPPGLDLEAITRQMLESFAYDES